MKTRAAVATAPNTDLQVRELKVDDPRPDELRVKLVATGVCHTDAIVRDQWYPVPQPVSWAMKVQGSSKPLALRFTVFPQGAR